MWREPSGPASRDGWCEPANSGRTCCGTGRCAPTGCWRAWRSSARDIGWYLSTPVTGPCSFSWHLLPLVVLLLPFRLAAQVPADSAGAPADSARADTLPRSDTLRSVELDRRDIFDPDERGWIARVANALHAQTRAATIRRELLFQPGQPYDSARIAESERNLRALGVFRRVRIDTVRTDSGLVARVLTKDGWSTRAAWRFRSTGGQVEYTIGVVEDNLLGSATSAAARYRQTPGSTSITLGFRRPRLFLGTIGLSAVHANRSGRRISSLALEQPRCALAPRTAFRLAGEGRKKRSLRFFHGAAV